MRLPLVSRKRYERVKAELDRYRQGIAVVSDPGLFEVPMDEVHERIIRERKAGEHR